MSHSRTFEKRLRELGFAPEREARHGTFWTDGQKRILMPRESSYGDPRAVRNKDAEINRLVAEGTERPSGEKSTVQQALEEPIAVKKYDPKKSQEILSIVEKCHAEGKTMVETVAILKAMNMKTPTGLEITLTHVRTYRQTLRIRRDRQREKRRATRATASNVPTPKASRAGKLPDTVIAILTDPDLSNAQKIRMITAYAE